MATDSVGQRRRPFAFAGAISGLVVDVAYLRLIADQDTGIEARVAFVASFIALMSLLALVGAIRPRTDSTQAPLMILAASSGFLGIGFVGLWSIGFALIVVGGMTLVAVAPIRVPAGATVGAIVTPLAVLAAGLLVTAY